MDDDIFVWIGVLALPIAVASLLLSLMSSGSLNYNFNQTQFLVDSANVSLNETYLNSFGNITNIYENNTYINQTANLSGYVPYQGATDNLDLNTKNITTTGFGKFTNLNIEYEGNIIGSGQKLSGLDFHANETSGINQNVAGIEVRSKEIWASGTEAGTRMDFWTTIQNTLTPITLMSMSATKTLSGVGFGTVSPDRQLHLFINSSATTFTGMKIENAGKGDAKQEFITSNSGILYDLGIDNSDGDKLKLSNTTNVGTNTIMTWTNEGRVGIGITSPTTKLDINGTIKASGNVSGDVAIFNQYITNSHVSDFKSKEKTSDSYFKDAMKWTNADGSINYEKHPAHVQTQRKIITYDSKCSEQDITDEKCNSTETIIVEDGLDLELRTAELEKMVYELKTENEDLKSRLTTLEKNINFDTIGINTKESLEPKKFWEFWK